VEKRRGEIMVAPDQRDKPNYDQAIKRLLSQAHDGFLALVAPDLTWRGERSPEVPAVARRADLVWEVERPGGQRGILHVELQTRVEADIGERLAEYAIRLWRRDHLPVRSLVVFLREAANVPTSPFRIPWGEQESLRYDFEIVRLWEVPQEEVLNTGYYDLWPLASLMAGVTVESTLAVAERLIAAPLPQPERSELTGLLAVLASMRLPLEAILNTLRREQMIEEIMRESGWAQLWREEGRQEGREEGREEGERQMAREMAQLALEGRFGALSEDVLVALRSADEATLRDLVAHVASDTLEQACARLRLS
jgi:predicted transposase YdaD